MSLTAQQFKVLNYFDIRKFVTDIKPLEAATGLSSEELESILLLLKRKGYYLPREKRITSKGEGAASSYRLAELNEAERNRLSSLYQEFEKQNIKLKQLVTDWQIKKIGSSQVINDHNDQEYDFEILGRLFDLHHQTDRTLQKFVRTVKRYSSYRKRLTLAVEKIKEGKPDYLSEPTIDSYHTVWFEFHEDLLKLMGKNRVE